MSEAVEEQLYRMYYIDRMKVRDIRKILQISGWKFYDILQTNNWKPRKELVKKILKREVKNIYYNKDYTLSKVMKKLNVSLNQLYKLLDRYKLGRRNNINRNYCITKKQIMETYNESNNYREAAQKLGVTLSWFGRHMKKFDIKPRVEKEISLFRTNIKKEQIERLYSKKLTMKEISKKLDITEGRVSKLITLFNIKKRTRQEIDILKGKKQLGVKKGEYKKYDNRDISKDIILDLYMNKHLKKNKISNELNISIIHLNRLMKRYNIKNRSWKGQHGTSWNGGQNVDNEGRKFVYMPSHPRAIGNYVANAILVKEKELGRTIQKGEIVHHKNFDCSDDNPKNLLVCTRSEHSKIHGKIWEVRK